MKYCPTCQTEFEEDIIRFCTKDGTPLIEKEKPAFTNNLPSESSGTQDDEEQQTIIRRKQPKNINISGKTDAEKTNVTAKGSSSDAGKEDSKRIVISTTGEDKKAAVGGQNVRSRSVGVGAGGANVPPPKKSNTALVVLMTIVGTLVVLAGAVGIYMFLSSQNSDDANSNLSVNENIDVNADLNENIDDNFNLEDFNLNTNLDNTNINTNLDLNINTGTPTPTRTPTPTPTPSPTPTPDSNTNTNTNANSATPTQTPVKTPTPPVKTPTPPPTPVRTPTPPTNVNRPVNVGMLNGRAVRLPTPTYPPEARQARAAGRVIVRVVVDESGNVISASAASGHPLLKRSAESAALRSKFRPVSVNGANRKASGTVVYNFVN